MTGEQQDTVLAHIRTSVLNTESDSCTGESEWVALSAGLDSKIEINVSKDGLTVTALQNKWIAHKDGCSDCEGWSL